MNQYDIYYTSLAIIGAVCVIYALLDYSANELDSPAVLGIIGGVGLLFVSTYKAREIDPSDFIIKSYGVLATILLAFLSTLIFLFELLG